MKKIILISSAAILFVFLVLICFKKNLFEIEQKKEVNHKDLISLMDISYDSAKNKLGVLNYTHIYNPEDTLGTFVQDDDHDLNGDSTDKIISLKMTDNRVTTVKYISNLPSCSDLENIMNEALKSGGVLDKKSNFIFFEDYVLIPTTDHFTTGIKIYRSNDFWEIVKKK
jgi:hypothetical protein